MNTAPAAAAAAADVASASTDEATTVEKPNTMPPLKPQTPFTNVILASRIIGFLLSIPMQISRLVVLNGTFADAMLNFCTDTWRRMSISRWPALAHANTKSFSFRTFRQRFQATRISSLRDDSLMEIENCAPAVSFRFRCPLLAVNLESTDEDGVLFCPVPSCRKKVFVLNADDIGNPQKRRRLAAGPGGGERRCIYIPRDAMRALRNCKGTGSGGGKEKKKADDGDDGSESSTGTLYSTQEFNIAVVTTASSPVVYDDSFEYDTGQKFLHGLHRVWQHCRARKAKEAEPSLKSCQDLFREKEFSFFEPESLFLGSDLLRGIFRVSFQYHITVRVFRVPAAVVTTAKETLGFLETTMRPAAGWQVLALVDPELQQLFQKRYKTGLDELEKCAFVGTSDESGDSEQRHFQPGAERWWRKAVMDTARWADMQIEAEEGLGETESDTGGTWQNDVDDDELT